MLLLVAVHWVLYVLLPVLPRSVCSVDRCVAAPSSLLLPRVPTLCVCSGGRPGLHHVLLGWGRTPKPHRGDRARHSVLARPKLLHHQHCHWGLGAHAIRQNRVPWVLVPGVRTGGCEALVHGGLV